jgi:transposase-like protein
MAKGKRLPLEKKVELADRLNKGESVADLANEYGVSEFSVREWGRDYKPKRTVRRAIKPKENTGVSPIEAESKGLREENQRLRNLLLDEILRNRGS